jgi:hypothetical protein
MAAARKNKPKVGANKVTSKKLASPRAGTIDIKSERKPEPVVEIHAEDSEVETSEKVITFFSRWREDQLVIEQAYNEQVGSNKWVTHPAKVCAFRDRAFVTNDAEKIEFIRKHPRYGFELFEFGNEKHKERIDKIDDSGRILELERQGRLARIMESRIKKGLAS